MVIIRPYIFIACLISSSGEVEDSVSGCLEFSIYCTALAKAVKQKDSEYWKTYPEFKNSIKFLLVKSEKVFFEGRNIFPSERQEKLLTNLQNHPRPNQLEIF